MKKTNIPSKRSIFRLAIVLLVAAGCLMLWQTPQNAQNRRAVALDFDGDGVSDLAVLRFQPQTPPATTLNWIIEKSDGAIYTPAGDSVTVQGNGASVTFPSVSSTGTTTFTLIEPGTAGMPPSGLTLCPECPAYDITTTVSYTPPLSVCLPVPASVDAATFLGLRLLHGENGVLVDRTSGRFTDEDGNRTVCGTVQSLSPFALAQEPTGSPSPTPTATPTPTPGGGVESDVNPRPDGNGIVVTGDVIQMRRFATFLDTPAAGSEYQRADSAPRTTFGDGLINAGDVTQARRYATFLDPPTAAAGPTGPPNLSRAGSKVIGMLDEVFSYFLGREIRVGSSKAATGDQVTVPIEMIPYGDEVGVGFTLEYDPALLQNPRVVLEDGVFEGAVLTVNDLEKGKLGILVDATGPITASAVGVRFVTVTFDVAEKTRGVTMIELTDSLASRSTSDLQGQTLATRWFGTAIELTGRKNGIKMQ